MEDNRAEIYKSDIKNDNDPRRFCIDWIESGAKVLDVGCACGDFGRQLKTEKNDVEIYGLEYNEDSINITNKTNSYKEIIRMNLNDLNSLLNIFLIKFDYIVFGDILEHLNNPIEVLKVFKGYLKENGYFLISLPNTAHASIKAGLLNNSFEYTEAGLLDKTHIHLFTYKSLLQLLMSLKLVIEDLKFTNWTNEFGTQNTNPYEGLPKSVIKYIFKDKHSTIVQYVFKCALSNDSSDIINQKNIKTFDKFLQLYKKPKFKLKNVVNKDGFIKKIFFSKK